MGLIKEVAIVTMLEISELRSIQKPYKIGSIGFKIGSISPNLFEAMVLAFSPSKWKEHKDNSPVR